MGTTTKNLGLYKPAANDYYNVETDQNENFDKIDEKFGEVDNGLNKKLNKGTYEGDADDLKREIDGKEPAFSKNSGFNKEKTSEYKSGKDAEKIFTQEGANNFFKEYNDNALINRGVTEDLNKALTNGVYYFYPSAANNPIDAYGYMQVFVNSGGTHDNSSNWIWQYYYTTVGNSLWRYKISNRSWSKWYKVWTEEHFNPDTKVNKSGDTMTGSLRTINVTSPFIANYTSSNLSGGFSRGYEVRINGVTKSEFGLYGSDGQEIYTYLGSDYADPALRLYHDGTLYLRAKNLKTNHKEVVDAINEVNNKVDTKLSKNDFAGNPILWRGASYNVTAALPGDVQSLNDVLYIQVFGANDNACIDGNFLQSISNGTKILLGYVQGSVDQILTMTKIDNRNFKFVVEGSGYETGGPEQTYKIEYIVLRRI